MTTEPAPKIPILESAWRLYAQLDTASVQRTKPNLNLRRWILILGVLTTFFAIVTEVLPDTTPAIVSTFLKVILVSTPIIGSALAAFTKQYFMRGDYLVMRAGAEEVLKEIYNYRTILKDKDDRRDWLDKRLADIRRQVYRGLSGEMNIPDYEGDVPHKYKKDEPEQPPKKKSGKQKKSGPESDPGYADLTGEQYFHFRLIDQLDWHREKIIKTDRKRKRLQISIILAGALSALLAAIGGSLVLWVALTSSLAAALISWQELRNQDYIVKNYSKVVVELGILVTRWSGLELEERTDGEFFTMVNSAEEILWGQNVEYIKAMQEALVKLDLDEEADLITSTVKDARAVDRSAKKDRQNKLAGDAAEAARKAGKAVSETFKAAVGKLAEEASSEIVQQELAAMGKAVTQAAEALVGRGSRFRHSLDEIAAQFADKKIGKETPSKELNEMISKFPPTGEVKG